MEIYQETIVIAAQAAISFASCIEREIPAYAGMTRILGLN
jgi:hypothetical protein